MQSRSTHEKYDKGRADFMGRNPEMKLAADMQLDKLTQGGKKKLSPEALKNTKMYQLNQQWIEKVKKEGYTIYDIGDTDGASVFYNLEKEVVYGAKKGSK